MEYKKKTLIIAEAGVNHNGSIELAKKLIEVAASAGVDIVKFQTFKAINLVSKDALKADYQKQNMSDVKDDTQFNMLKQLELTHEHHLILIEHCKKYNIRFQSTAFDIESIELLNNLGINIWKIPSGEITNLPFLKKIASLNAEVILSTGMSTIAEVNTAINILVKNGTKKEKITVLHCNTEYPTPYEDVNLRAMLTIRDQLGVKVGYSDHTLGVEVSVAAVALGAEIIEKHFTLNRDMPGPDHKASLEPNELAILVNSIRHIDSALGNGDKKPSSSEQKNMIIARKSIHLNTQVNKGQIILESDLLMLRPGDGISPMEMDKVIGKKVNRDLPNFHKLNYTDLT
jgi:N,N'-diacetyllegionaminate synthase